MSDRQDCTASASNKRSYAALIESEEQLSIQERPVVIGKCLPEGAIARSGLLSGIGNTNGPASLPDQLSADEVDLWHTACFVDVELPPEELATVVKVADTLGDTGSTDWQHKLADAAVAHYQQEDGLDLDDMLAALLSLPPHLLPGILSRCLSKLPLSGALATFPPPLHHAIISAAAGRGSMRFAHDIAPAVLASLPVTVLPSPGLKCLSISEELPRRGTQRTAEPRPVCCPPSTGALLATAVSAHSSLTALYLNSTPLPPQWLRSFSARLAPGALPALADLALCTEAHPGGCAEVAACLHNLPALTELSISLHMSEPSNPDAPSATTFTRLSYTPVSLPSLAELHISEHAPGHWMYAHKRTCAPALLSVLAAPALTRLHLNLDTARVPLRSLRQQVSRFPRLKELNITAAVHTSDFDGNVPDTTDDVCSRLPALASVTVDSSCQASSPILAAAMAALGTASLTSVLVVGAGTDSRDECSRAETAAAGPVLFRELGRCTQLRHLQLECLSTIPAATRAGFSSALASALVQLTQLTHLRLQSDEGEDVHLRGPVLSHAISKLTTLRLFEIDSSCGGLQFDSAGPVVAACAALTQVTRLALHFEGVTPQQVCQSLPGRLPVLRELELRFSMFSGDPELEALRARFRNVSVMI